MYGDRIRILTSQQLLGSLTSRLTVAERTPPGMARHELLLRAFLDASSLAQGIADAAFQAKGCDDLSAAQDTAMALLLSLGRKLTASAWSDFAVAGPPVAPKLLALALQALPDQVPVRTPEGYAFYAVYPAAYLKAAAEHRWPSPPLVIGLRSIGVDLACQTIRLRPGSRT